MSDYPVLAHAVAEKAEIIPLFIFDPYIPRYPETGVGREQFLLGCLDSLQKNLEYLGSTLIQRYGEQHRVLTDYTEVSGLSSVFELLPHPPPNPAQHTHPKSDCPAPADSLPFLCRYVVCRSRL